VGKTGRSPGQAWDEVKTRSGKHCDKHFANKTQKEFRIISEKPQKELK
jgi:hypothetical protein